MVSVDQYKPEVFCVGGGKSDHAEPCFGGPYHGNYVAAPDSRLHFDIMESPQVDYIQRADGENITLESLPKVTRYYREFFDKQINDLSFKRISVWLASGWSFSEDEIRRIMWELENSPTRLIPEPNILTEFDLWFRRACYKHRITDKIVLEVEDSLRW